MKSIPNVGWAFFGLIVIVLASYALNKGLFIGSSTEVFDENNRKCADPWPCNDVHRTFYRQTCRYLYLTGIERDEGWRGQTREEASHHCPLLHDMY